ncbi:MAG: TetR/AcrR family transcriptional regulator [Hyphomonadaceae bacterium]
MAKNGNSVNIESSGERYHHGDLRAALIEEGLKRLKDGPADELSLREIARNVGVSATAVYRHFPDKAALLSALAEAGGERMASAFSKAMAAEKSGKDAFDAMGRAYVKFALANPSLFRLMTASKAWREKGGGADGSRGMGMLVDALQGLSGGSLSRQKANIQRLQAWSIVHGLAMLMLDGQVPPDDKIIEQVLASKIV